MGCLRLFKCCNCGYKVFAPDNETGRYYVKAGNIQLFSCSSHHNIVNPLISQEYLNEEANDEEVKRILEDIVASGDIRDRLSPPLIEWKEDKRRKHKIQPWNAHTGRCPKCGSLMASELEAPCICVD